MNKILKAIKVVFTPAQTTPESNFIRFLAFLAFSAFYATWYFGSKTIGGRLADAALFFMVARLASVEFVNSVRGLLDELYDDLVPDDVQYSVTLSDMTPPDIEAFKAETARLFDAFKAGRNAECEVPDADVEEAPEPDTQFPDSLDAKNAK
jgi:hypothetical protein